MRWNASKKIGAKKIGAALTTLTLLSAVVACGDPSQNNNASGDDGYPTRIVLADREAGEGYHPASGYGQTGVSLVYDGLLRPKAGVGDKIPDFEVALASEMPKSNAAGTEWTITLKEGIKFSDGSDFDAADVKASYDIARDAEAGSEVAARYGMIKEVTTPNDHTVVFTMTRPYAEMLSRLTLAIAPSEIIKKTNVADSSLNTEPVGTGPYVMTENRSGELIYQANEDYWEGAPPVKELVITTTADDTARVQRVLAGEVDGAAIPPALVDAAKDTENVEIFSVQTADWYGISLPDVPELRDPKVRLALNVGVDRQAIIDGPLAGQGTAMDSMISEIYGDAYDPSKTFTYDTKQAEKLLDQAGWAKDDNGMRSKDGKPFHVTLYYASSDTTRRDIAVEFSSQMKKLGLDFETKAATWDELTPELAAGGTAVLGGGSAPYDLSVMAYEGMHTRTESTSQYANPGDYGSAELDALLEKAVSEMDESKRNKLWQEVQALYLEEPSAVALLTVNHVYVAKENNWKKPPTLLEPHIHDTTWGPWWRLSQWHK